ncbi:uncharacterized protein F4812DRAFT_427308 [Daldinia caldariorum]|uniref:uncharacterized protein n=1 Tax=Daldinia caldariorum TaxID=326644 RepID=UPI002008D78B|nr:uncharacterized protein F4812DRAFT_427308 [Daldinia caldariorum]KAI1468567.1 hypothetical protein F4812DRAFT_427308 [Daldinia caldariorum]
MEMSVYGAMGDEDIALAFRLMQEDAEQFISTSSRKGKQAEGTETDAQMAFNLLLEELQAAETCLSDERMTRSMLRAIQTDGPVLSQAYDEENVARADRNLSIALSNGQDVDVAEQGTPESPNSDEEFLEKLSVLYNTGFDHPRGSIFDYDDDDTATISQPESSSWAASRQPSRPPKTCDACGDEKHFAELARAPCHHEYCRECLTRLFRDASNDESLFPPRCCRQNIPLAKNQVFIDSDVVRTFRQKAIEFSTPRRTYCHNRRCARFIPGTNYLNDVATCSHCGYRTCMICKGATHNGDCPEDEQLNQVIELATEHRWQRCQRCWAMVELNTGCNHMTCRCGFQFCYVCGDRWKTCECVHWDEHRLYTRAVVIDARDEGDERPAEVIPFRPHQNGQQAVQQPVQQPIANQQQAPAHFLQQGGRLPAGAYRVVFESDDESEDEVEEEAEVAVQPVAEQAPWEPPAFEFPELDIVRRARVQQLMEDLRHNHECQHDRWFSKRGPRGCEECGDVMPIFIYECRQCHIMACRRCRYHRL